ncbi:MAG: hypothetical protein HOP08_13570 [Cyclobacteriaceae bacterium]|nr:hypothetical protein [Cyclobacteriaceae bacterium]
MKNIPLLLLAVTFLMTSCKKDEVKKKEGVDPLASGVYKGEFYRGGPLIDAISSHVTIVVTDNKFEGSSDVSNYPSICSGTFSVSGSKINFSNACAFTANFDWTLILGGEYDLEVNGNEVIMIHRYDDGNFDRYRLSKQ